MAEHSIIFSAPMIQALLEGRKTQTRRRAWNGRDKPTLWQRVQPGDRLWVRESFATTGGGPVRYYATDDVHDLRKRRSPIHMPRWASRITLTVTEVRRQLLQEITEEDAQAEGVTRRKVGDLLFPARPSFASLWQELHPVSPGRWVDDPEVVALTFTVEQRNIDRG